jgi:CheY-like chemotaxis protein
MSPVPRILVVDDNVDAASGLGRLLSLLGYDVRVVNDGASAVAGVDGFVPQVVLLDLGMPGMDGLETAERIRRCENGHDVSLIAVTGWGQEKDRQRTEAAGFVAHLTKPVNLDHLEALLSRLTGKTVPGNPKAPIIGNRVSSA